MEEISVEEMITITIIKETTKLEIKMTGCRMVPGFFWYNIVMSETMQPVQASFLLGNEIVTKAPITVEKNVIYHLTTIGANEPLYAHYTDETETTTAPCTLRGNIVETIHHANGEYEHILVNGAYIPPLYVEIAQSDPVIDQQVKNLNFLAEGYKGRYFFRRL